MKIYKRYCKQRHPPWCIQQTIVRQWRDVNPSPLLCPREAQGPMLGYQGEKWVQHRATKRIHCLRRGWELGLFGLEKKREGSGVYKYLVAGAVRGWRQTQCLEWQEKGNGLKLKHRKFYLMVRKNFLLWAFEILEQAAHTGCGISVRGDTQTLPERGPEQCAVAASALSRGLD